MSSGGSRQCGLGSLLPMSCRGRAEAFARRLHTRLRRLGSEPRPGEDSWLTAQPSQPRHLSDSDVYFDFDVDIASPSSPVEDPSELELQMANGKPDPESGCVFSSPAEQDSPPSNSDSDATYYDLENDPSDPKHQNYPKYQRLYDENQVANNIVNIAKLKISASDIRDQLLNCKPSTPDRQSPIKTQPLARENGFTDYGSLDRGEIQNALYSPIRFDDCQKLSPRNSVERETSAEVEEVDSLGSSAVGNSVVGGQISREIMGKDEVDCIVRINGKTDATLNAENGEDLEVDSLEDEMELFEDQSNTFKFALKKLDGKRIMKHEGSPELNNENSETVEESVESENVEIPEIIEIQNTEELETTEGDTENPDDDRPQRVRRCSSLRTGKTPPGTPGRKKIVRFADVLGLDLADVKTFMDDIPYIPKSAFEDLRDADLNLSSSESFTNPPIQRCIRDKRLLAMFQSPGDQPNFIDILNARSVCLESAVIQEGTTISICGTVRVRNLDFHKSVQIRYTLDNWKTFSDLQASYVPNSCDGFCDRFQFLLYAHILTIGQKLEFAVRFMCKGCQFWDNNSGANYCFQCVACNPQDNFYQPACINTIDSNSWLPSFY